MITGRVQREDVSDFTFDEQYHTFMRYNYAADPSKPNQFVGDKNAFMAANSGSLVPNPASSRSS